MSATATLAGVPLEALETVAWRETQGVVPYQRTFEVHKDRAAAILKNAPTSKTPVELFVGGGGRKPLLVERLYVLNVGPSNHPDRVSVLVVDERYWAESKLVVRRYNVRRRSGEYRLVEGKLERITSLPDVTFAKYSLKSELTAWLAKEVIEDVLEEVAGKGRWSWGKVDPASIRQVDVDGLELQDDGQSALKRALDYVPSLTVFVSKRGIWTLTLKEGGGEEEQLANAPPPIVGPSLAGKIDMRRSRPSAIEVYVQPEDEVRFDFLEGILTTTSSREPRIMRNVLPLPDRELVISGKKVVVNTWVEINQALLDAWNNDTVNPAAVNVGGQSVPMPPISFEIIREVWFSPGGYHFWYEIHGGNSVWAKRWNALMRHYRQTFQIDRRWRDRIRSARAERVAIIDPENARRAPADVFADHALIPSSKRALEVLGDAAKKMAVNEYAWPISDTTRLLVNGSLAETALLVPVDEDQMIFHVRYQPDFEGNTQAIAPFILSEKTDGGPVDIPQVDPLAPQALMMRQLAQPSPKHRFTTVLTVAPASPQGLKSLYKITVTPNDAKKVLPKGVAERIGPCDGPVYQLFVPPGVTTAPFAWQDEKADEIEGAILDGKPRSSARLIYPDHIGNVAKSVAAIVYALFADRNQGAHVSDWDPDAEPVGRIATVIHQLGVRGVQTTRREMPPSVKALNFRSLLPDDTRRLLFGKVQP